MSGLGSQYADTSFVLLRKDTFQETWALTQTDSNGVVTPVDLTGFSLTMPISQIPGDGSPVMTLVETGGSTVSGLHVATPRTAGQVTVTIRGADLSAVGAPKQISTLQNLLILTDSTPNDFTWGVGTITLRPAV